MSKICICNYPGDLIETVQSEKGHSRDAPNYNHENMKTHKPHLPFATHALLGQFSRTACQQFSVERVMHDTISNELTRNTLLAGQKATHLVFLIF